MEGHPMRTLGKLLVIWGVLLPLISLPSTAFGYYGVIPLLSISLRDILLGLPQPHPQLPDIDELRHAPEILGRQRRIGRFILRSFVS
jgi:hypothetical protein